MTSETADSAQPGAPEDAPAPGVGGNRRPLDARRLTPTRAAILDLVLAGVTEASVIAERHETSRQTVYEHLDHLIAGGWVVKAHPAGNRTVAFQPTSKAREETG